METPSLLLFLNQIGGNYIKMDKTKFLKWSRLFFAALMAALLAISLVPAVAFAQDCDDCIPCECPDGNCKLQVNIVMPDNYMEVQVCDYFWVNATVSKPADVAEVDDVMVEVYFDDTVVSLVGGYDKQQGPFELDNCYDVKDFWWKFQCIADKDVEIKVEATTEDDCNGDCDTVMVRQYLPECECLEVEIIECPDTPIMPSTTFAVKALVKNTCEYEICGIDAQIEWTGPASIQGGVPEWEIGCLRPGQAEEVGWTFHCDGGGEVDFTVEAGYGEGCSECVSYDECTVYQICEAGLKGYLTAPEKVCADCDNLFDVTIDYCNICNIIGWIDNLNATIYVDGNAEVIGSELVTLDDLEPGDCGSYTWEVECTGEGDVEIWVVMKGYDPVNHKAISTFETKHVVVDQNDPLMLQITEPYEMEKISVGQTFELKYRVSNCTDFEEEGMEDVLTGIALGAGINPCVKLANPMVTIIPAEATGHPTYTVPSYRVDDTCWQEVMIDCICDCQYVDVIWTLECCCSGMCDVDIDNGACGGDCTLVCPDKIEAYARLNGWEDYDDVTVQQMEPPCLIASLDAYEGVMSMGTFDGQETIKRSDCQAIAPCNYYTVVVPIANVGEAMAEDVNITVTWTGPAEYIGDVGEVDGNKIHINLGDIACHSSDKAVLEFHCVEEGEVMFSVTEINGMDANSGFDVTCLDYGCVIWVDQLPLTVEVIQPLTCTPYIVGDTFTVKAKVCNESDIRLGCVDAWLVQWGSGSFAMVPNQDPVAEINELLPGECAEVTWQVVCTGSGDTTFEVHAANQHDDGEEACEECGPEIEVVSNPETIHQFDPGRLCAYIVSPRMMNHDDCCEEGDPEAYVATGQLFVVTAKIFNSGQRPVEVKSIVLDPEGMGDIEILSGPTIEWPGTPNILEEGEYAVLSWDVRCVGGGYSDIVLYVLGEDDMGTIKESEDDVWVKQYPAAFITVDITGYPTEDVMTGSEFVLTADLCNIGQADASSVMAHLSVFPAGSVLVSENDPVGSYDKSIGTLIGHEVNQCKSVSWTLTCADPGNSTITISVTGEDEYGYEVKQICTSEIKHEHQITCCELVLDGTPLAPIPARFTVPDSVTVKQVDENGGGGGGEEDGSVDIQLVEGWNLISMPFVILPADRDPEDLLADISGTMIAVYSYDACTEDFASYNPDPMVPDFLTEIVDGLGYWLYMNESDILTINESDLGGGVPPTYTNSCTGYNLIGPRIGEQADTLTVADWLGSKPVSAVVAWNNVTGSFYILTGSSYIQPGMGYFVYFDGTATRAY